MSEELKSEVRETLDNKVPQIKGHGGRFDIDRADSKSGVVELSLSGACGSCVIAPMTMSAIENQLPELLDGVEEVHVETENTEDETMTVPSKTARMEELDEYEAYSPPSNQDGHF